MTVTVHNLCEHCLTYIGTGGGGGTSTTGGTFKIPIAMLKVARGLASI